jgi:hypothetical protein
MLNVPEITVITAMLAPGGSIGGPAVHVSSAGVSRITWPAEPSPTVVGLGPSARAEAPTVKLATRRSGAPAVPRHIVFMGLSPEVGDAVPSL